MVLEYFTNFSNELTLVLIFFKTLFKFLFVALFSTGPLVAVVLRAYVYALANPILYPKIKITMSV